MNNKIAIGLLLLVVAFVSVPGASAYNSPGWLGIHPTSNPTPEACGGCHPAIAPSCTSCHSNPFTLTVKANPTTVTAGTTESVTFTVTRNASTQVVAAAIVDLSGVATGSGTTSTAGTAAIDVNANSAGTITAIASKTGYVSGTTTVTANEPAPPPDTTPPVITAPAAVTAEATGTLTSVAIGTATATDLVDATPTITNDAPASYPVGVTTVTWTATDDAGNSATATQTVTITDTTAPSITAPAAVTAEATGTLTSVAIGTATATDLVDATPTITNDAPASYPVGVTTVTWTATDDAGNSATATQTVTVTAGPVTDTTPPVITAPADVSVEAAAVLPMIVDIGMAAATDDSGVTPVITNNAPALFGLGETIVTWTATDGSGNSATATQKVTVTPVVVTDTTPPVITAPADVSVEAAAVLPMAVDIGMAAATDDSGVAPVITNNAPALFGLGETIVTWTATDGSGNSATATQKVTVTVAPSPPPGGTYTVTFEVTDSMGNPVRDAEIEMEGGLDEITIKTNEAGKAIFTVASGAYSYEVEKDGYLEIENSISVNEDTIVSLVLVKEHKKEERNSRTLMRSIHYG